LVILNFKNLKWNKKHHSKARESLKFEKGINYIKDGEVKSFQFNYEANECR
jgi:predicted small secreted protein